MALARSPRCCRARLETSAAANAAVSPARSAIAASATPRNARASRRPRVPPRGGTEGSVAADGCLGAGSVIPGQAEPVAAAEDGLHDPGVARIVLDLAPQVLHVRVDGTLVTLEL